MKASYRDNYARPAEIKRKYGPANLFRVNQLQLLCVLQRLCIVSPVLTQLTEARKRRDALFA
ncbi:BBE domain-containing protein [Cupriavidus sp. IDO]|uniref:BBE domain-containing protein n=1 Tax=Cupriavidus sp. IDO TaxID=1539142 RepID=UPI000579633B|nr:hypothetical protein RM96_29645 [Cupriavidus sp. IDO]